jgi:HSP20 family molecular chaperone IbpA
MQILVLPSEFGQFFHLDYRALTPRPVRTAREAGRLLVSLDVPDFAEEELTVAVSRERLMVLGSGSGGSFTVQVDLPRDAMVSDIVAELTEGRLQVAVPLQAQS